ncbi:MAG: hypothetical protein LUC21_08450 [Oscillospiraceae bacterium]|nr:hypothetical protein [Oscillospiraceae bacterium]
MSFFKKYRSCAGTYGSSGPILADGSRSLPVTKILCRAASSEKTKSSGDAQWKQSGKNEKSRSISRALFQSQKISLPRRSAFSAAHIGTADCIRDPRGSPVVRSTSVSRRASLFFPVSHHIKAAAFCQSRIVPLLIAQFPQKTRVAVFFAGNAAAADRVRYKKILFFALISESGYGMLSTENPGGRQPK